MKQRPDTAGLLEAARRELLDTLVPQLSGGSKYAALMVASALATALRDLQSGGGTVEEELALFRALYGDEPVASAGKDPADALPALNSRLAGELRAGDWDAMPATLRSLLFGQIRLRLARSNPKFLDNLEMGGCVPPKG